MHPSTASDPNMHLVAPLPPVAAGIQQPLFGADGSEPLLQGQAGVVSGGPGRPLGSQNRFKKDLAKAVAHEFGGQHPLVKLARMANRAIDKGLAGDADSLEEIAQVFGCTKRSAAGQVLVGLVNKIVDCTTPKLSQIKADVTHTVPIVWGDLGQENVQEAVNRVAGDLLDLAANDFNDLDEGQG